jgi:hypothetical protein
MRLNLLQIIREHKRERKTISELRKYKEGMPGMSWNPKWDENRRRTERAYDDAIVGLIVKYRWTNEEVNKYKTNHGRVGLLVEYQKLEEANTRER